MVSRDHHEGVLELAVTREAVEDVARDVVGVDDRVAIAIEDALAQRRGRRARELDVVELVGCRLVGAAGRDVVRLVRRIQQHEAEERPLLRALRAALHPGIELARHGPVALVRMTRAVLVLDLAFLHADPRRLAELREVHRCRGEDARLVAERAQHVDEHGRTAWASSTGNQYEPCRP